MATGSQKRLVPPSSPEVILFRDPDKLARERLNRRKAAKLAAEEASKQSEPDSTKSKQWHTKTLKKTDYHDMLRFGISELKGEEKVQARIRLAVELGAKPPKQVTKNYKVFLEEQKRNKEEQKRIHDEKHVLMTAVKMSKLKTKKDFRKNRRKGRATNKVPGGLSGQVGLYKRGVQFIKHKDFSKTDRKDGPRKK